MPVVLATALAGPSSAAESDSEELSSGVEGSKAALVRIEVSATTEIVHVDHTTGDVALARGRYVIPVDVATGVVTSADGIIATAGDSLTVDETEVGVHAANLLFTREIGVQVKGNHGDPTRRGFTTDRYWRDHLQHCYDREEHCILFVVPQYTVYFFTKPTSRANAELVNDPERPGDVGLLQVGGGGGMPTARLAADDAGRKPTRLLGFTERPAPSDGPRAIDVEVDTKAEHVGSKTALAPRLSEGLTGGPVVDTKNGEVIGLVYPHDSDHGGGGDDPGAQLISQSAVRRAMEEAHSPPTPSQFDAVFKRGVDQLAGGGSPASAEGSFKESRTYYPSALAAQHMETAAADGDSADAAPGAAPETDEQSSGWLPGGVWTMIGVLILVAAGGYLLVNRIRSRRLPDRRASAPQQRAPGRAAPVGATTAKRSPADAPASEREVRRSPGDHEEAREGAATGPRRSATYCTSCGARLSPRTRFCGNCGEPIG